MPMTAAGGSKAAESGDHDLLARAIDKISSLELELNQLKISKGNGEPTPTPANSHRSVGTTPAPSESPQDPLERPGDREFDDTIVTPDGHKVSRLDLCNNFM